MAVACLAVVKGSSSFSGFTTKYTLILLFYCSLSNKMFSGVKPFWLILKGLSGVFLLKVWVWIVICSPLDNLSTRALLNCKWEFLGLACFVQDITVDDCYFKQPKKYFWPPFTGLTNKSIEHCKLISKVNTIHCLIINVYHFGFTNKI